MNSQIDRFNNAVSIGDMVVYCGTSVGLVIGTIVKVNPLSYKVKYFGKSWRDEKVERYVNVPFSYSNSILTEKSLQEFDKLELLNEMEKLRLGFTQ